MDKIKSFRKHEIAIGVLFILVIAVSVFGGGFEDSMVADGVYGNKFITGIISELFNNFCVVAIAVLFFPILKKYSDWGALGYIASRIMEAVLLMIVTACALLSCMMSEIPASLIDVLIKSRFILFQLALLWLGAGSVLLFLVLHKNRLVPRFISVWGIVGYAAIFIVGLANLFGVPTLISNLLYIPGGLFEVGFPIWLFIKGFSNSEDIYD